MAIQIDIQTDGRTDGQIDGTDRRPDGQTFASASIVQHMPGPDPTRPRQTDRHSHTRSRASR
jgi:hypothetical protein